MNMWSVDASVHHRQDIDALANLMTILVSVIVMNEDTGKRNLLVKVNRVPSGTEMSVAVTERVWCQEG